MANFTPVGVELIVKGADKFNSTLGKASGSIAGFGKTAVKTAAIGAAAIGTAAIGIGAASVTMAVSFESAFAGVIKTTDGLVDEFGELTDAGKEMQKGFRDLSKEIPVTVEELLAIGEIGGQLGIAKEDLVDFTRTIADMGESSNLSTEEAAVGFAQLANVMGTASGEISNMGSSVVALGNNLATNERDVLSFAQRIAGTGAVAGVTEADIFGISAAFSSVGIQAQAGGTAVSKVFLDINQAVVEGGETLEIFAATSGIKAEDFGAAWEEDAGAVFGEFVKGLGLAGDDAGAILDALGIKDSQAIRAFLSLAQAGDLVTDAMDLSSEAYAKNTALTAEAEARYRTTESQFKIFKNTIKDVGITIGQKLLPAMNKVLEFGLKIANAVGDLAKVFGERGIKDFFTTFEDGSSVLSGFFEKLGLGEKPARKIADVINTIAQVLIKNIPKAIKIATKFWNKTLLPALKNFGKFITRTIIPAVKQIVRWFQDNIPIAIGILKGAISTLAAFWESTLLPGIQTVVKFVQDNLVPILSGIAVLILTIVIPAIVAWAAANVAAAIATLVAWAPIIAAALAIVAVVAVLVKAWQKDWGGIQTKTRAVWKGTIKPIFEKIKEWIENVVIPAVKNLVGWFQDNIPKAMEAVERFWKGTLKPTLEAIWKFIKDNIIPIIKTAYDWLKKKIPEAFEAVKSFWSNVLRPTLDEIWAFIRDNIIPIIKKAYNWLKIKIPEAFEAVKSFWNSTLKPALDELWAFVRDNVIPIIEDAVDWLKVQIPEAFKVFKRQWEEILKPALEAIWKFIKDPLIVWFTKLWSWIAEKVPEAFEVLKAWWARNGEAIISGIAGGIGMITQALRDVVEWVGKAIAALKELLGLQGQTGGSSGGGGSGFDDDDDDDDETTSTSSFTGTSFVPAPAAPMGPAAASFGNTLNLTINPTINSEMDMVTFEQRVRRVVTDAVSV